MFTNICEILPKGLYSENGQEIKNLFHTCLCSWGFFRIFGQIIEHWVYFSILAPSLFKLVFSVCNAGGMTIECLDIFVYPSVTHYSTTNYFKQENQFKECIY